MSSKFTSPPPISTTCQVCNAPMLVPQWRIDAGRGKYCGMPCRNVAKSLNTVPLETRFWQNVQKTDTCWIWTGSVMWKGYGTISDGSKQNRKDYRAHRLSYQIHFGEIPDDLKVLHKCDNPICVNPEHLFLGTNADNSADMVAKGRSVKGQKRRPEQIVKGERHGSRTKPESTPRGQSHSAAKLTDAQVIEIRKRYAQGGILQKELAAEYQIGRPVICEILSGKMWKHLL